MKKLIGARWVGCIKRDPGSTCHVVLGESPKLEIPGNNETGVKVFGFFGEMRAQGKCDIITKMHCRGEGSYM